MKTWVRKKLISPEFQQSMLGPVLRGMLRKRKDRLNPWFLLDTQATERPHYAYCMLHAARLAQKLGIERISAIEFGVAGGNGIAFMADFARQVERVTGVAIDIYGFDTGVGMPDPEGAKDLPYWFRAAQYPMDQAALRKKVPSANLVIGEIRDTIGSFIKKYKPAPIGVILNDVDYFSSTVETFKLFDRASSNSKYFMPRIFMYFDDIIGTDTEMYGQFNGQLAAISEFNNHSTDVKIHLNQNLLPKSHLRYRYQIYYCHIFSHARYNEYLGDAQQAGIYEALKLK